MDVLAAAFQLTAKAIAEGETLGGFQTAFEARMTALGFAVTGTIDPAGLRHLIESHLPYARIEDARLPLHIMATDPQGVGVRLSDGPAVEAILASKNSVAECRQ